MEAQSEAAVSPSDRPTPKIISWTVLLLVLLHGTQASYRLWGDDKAPGPGLSPADLLIAVAFVAWLVSCIRRGRMRLPPLGLPLLGVFWLGLSLLPFLKNPEGITVARRGIVDVCQFAEYFLVSYLLFAECLQHPKARRWAFRLLALSVLLSVILAAGQYFSGVRSLKVRGAWFDDRNTFGVFLALTLPLLYGTALFAKCRIRRTAIVTLAVAALCVCLSGGAWLAISVGLLTVASLKGPSKMVSTGALLILLAVFLLPRLPRVNSDVLLDSVALYSSEDRFHTFNEDVDKVRERLAEKQKALAGKIGEGEALDFADLPTEQDHSWKWRRRYTEWQAALNMAAREPLFGVGVGSYQKNINRFYEPMPKYPVNLMEPNTQNMYLVWGASAGVPLLLILFGMADRAARLAARLFHETENRFDRGMAAGLLGSLAAFAVVGVFADPLVRGTGITFALLLGLAQALRNSGTRSKGAGP
jgi:O-antigen ligase